MAKGDGRGEPSSSFTGRASGDDLAVALSRVARSLQDEATVQGTLAPHTLAAALRTALEQLIPRR